MAVYSVCSFPDCGKPHKAKGYCNKHYKRLLDFGTPEGGPKKMCSIPDCELPFFGRGWCRKHYDRWLRTGDPLTPRKRPANGEPSEYYESVVLSYDGDDCFVWPYYRMKSGYPILMVGTAPKIVSRLVCEATHGPPPSPNHEASHSCGNGHLGCVAKRHLVWKTPKENSLDRIIHGTQKRGEEHVFAKLSENDVLEIRALAGKLSQRQIAALFSISQGQVGRILHRRNWSHL